MPFLQIQTNLEVSPADRDMLLTQASELVSTHLGKDEKYFMGLVQGGQSMSFGGSEAPLAFLQLKALGLPTDHTSELSAALCTLVTDTLAIPAERIYIEFSNVERGMWGWNGGVF